LHALREPGKCTFRRNSTHSLSGTVRGSSPYCQGFSSETGCFGCNLWKTEPIIQKVEVNALKQILGLSAHSKHTSSSTLSHTAHTAPPPPNPYSLTHLFAAASCNCAISCSNHWHPHTPYSVSSSKQDTCSLKNRLKPFPWTAYVLCAVSSSSEPMIPTRECNRGDGPTFFHAREGPQGGNCSGNRRGCGVGSSVTSRRPGTRTARARTVV
jgi:hypothetical protein